MELILIILWLASSILGLSQASGEFKGLFSNAANLSALEPVCRPYTSTGFPDQNAPCNSVDAIVTQCEFGLSYSNIISDSSVSKRQDTLYASESQCEQDWGTCHECGVASSNAVWCAGSLHPYDSEAACEEANDPDEAYCDYCNNEPDDYTYCAYASASASDSSSEPYIAQQVCYCSSQVWELTLGCATCYTAHGAAALQFLADPKLVSSFSSSYCVASAAPTDSWRGYAETLIYEAVATAYGQLPSALTLEVSNTLGSATDASLYFTPASVTGTAAYIIPNPTLTNAPSVNDGQIKATASANFVPPSAAAATASNDQTATLATSQSTSASTTAMTSSRPDSTNSVQYDSTVTISSGSSTSVVANAAMAVKHDERVLGMVGIVVVFAWL